MPRSFVLTLTGPDRVGLVEELTRLVLAREGNVDTSRMARLGGAFAVLMLVTLPDDSPQAFETDLAPLRSSGFHVHLADAGPDRADARSGWHPFRIEVHGADHEGIIHEVARYLSLQGINIESLDTETSLAPVTAAPLFDMVAIVAVPPTLEGSNWEHGLDEVADRQNVEITVFPAPVE
jgi:glycine cleavage system transcriptional repressor